MREEGLKLKCSETSNKTRKITARPVVGYFERRGWLRDRLEDEKEDNRNAEEFVARLQ